MEIQLDQIAGQFTIVKHLYKDSNQTWHELFLLKYSKLVYNISYLESLSKHCKQNYTHFFTIVDSTDQLFYVRISLNSIVVYDEIPSEYVVAMLSVN